MCPDQQTVMDKVEYNPFIVCDSMCSQLHIIHIAMERYWSHKSGVKARAKPQEKAGACAKTPVGVDTTPQRGWGPARCYSKGPLGFCPSFCPGYCLCFLKWNWNWPSNRMQYWNGSISISASSANHSLASQNLFSIAQLSYSDFLKEEKANPNG